MTKSEAKSKIEKLRQELEFHNRKYYLEAKPVISDRESPFYVALARCTAAFLKADYAGLAEHRDG